MDQLTSAFLIAAPILVESEFYCIMFLSYVFGQYYVNCNLHIRFVNSLTIINQSINQCMHACMHGMHGMHGMYVCMYVCIMYVWYVCMVCMYVCMNKNNT